MGRSVSGRTRVVGWLEAQTPLSVGGLGRDADVDLVVARDGLGRAYVPGTSLAGPIRSWVEVQAAENERWGHVDKDSDDGGQASRVVVDDGLVVPAVPEAWDDEDPLAALDLVSPVEHRDGVGLDRVTGAAAPSILYRRDVLSRGARIRFRLSMEARTLQELESDRPAAVAIAAALGASRIRFGAGKTRGLGRVRLDLASARFYVERLDSAAGVLDSLRGSTAIGWDAFRKDAEATDQRPEKTEVVVSWRPLGPIMVKTGLASEVADAMPLLGATSAGALVQVLPGASVKGALRRRAELIVRTVLGRDAPRGDKPRRRFLDQLSQFALIDALFGRARGSDDDEPKRCLGAVSVDDCYSKSEPIPHEDWLALITETDPERLRKLATKHGFRRADHVAIDRWTGGAADHLLFNALEPKPGQWEDLRIEVDVKAIDDPARALLGLVLRDLQRGLIPLGFATNRGMGAIEVSSVTPPWGARRSAAGVAVVGGGGAVEVTAVLWSAAREGVSLAAAIGMAGFEDANALLSTPSSYWVARVADGGCHTRLGVVDLAVVYEARCFQADAELRWLQDRPATADAPPTGTAVLVAADEAVAGRLGVKAESLMIEGTMQTTYLLWGRASAELLGSGWTRLEEYRVGSVEVPVNVSAARRRVLIDAIEYVGLDGEGNASVVEERLVGFAEAPYQRGQA